MEEFDYPLPGDEEAEEALAAQRERARVDAAASEEDDSDDPEPADPHAAEREALGFDLAWWAEEGEHGSPNLDIVVDIANQVCGITHYLRDAEQFGFDPTKSEATITLDAVSWPLAVAALHILGTLHSHIRPEVTAALKLFEDGRPAHSEEQNESLRLSSEEMEREELARMAESMGVWIATEEDLADKVLEEHERETGFGRPSDLN